jgi:hypothetical protein
MVLPRILVCLASLLAASPAIAQIRSEPPLAIEDNALELTTLGQRLTLPAPDWAGDLVGQAILTGFEAVFRSGDDQADLELYQNGAVYALARTRYGAHVVSDPDADPADYRAVVIDGFSRACMPGLSAFVQLGDDPEDVLAPLLLICGAQRADNDTGEIMVISLQTSEAGMAIVYQQWRGAAFDPASAANWPAPPETIEARARLLQAQTMLTLAD